MNAADRSPTTWDGLEADGVLEGLEWEYVAADAACDVGRDLHGHRLASLAEVYDLLPDFNENPQCSRRPCGCTALPVIATDAEA